MLVCRDEEGMELHEQFKVMCRRGMRPENLFECLDGLNNNERPFQDQVGNGHLSSLLLHAVNARQVV